MPMMMSITTEHNRGAGIISCEFDRPTLLSDKSVHDPITPKILVSRMIIAVHAPYAWDYPVRCCHIAPKKYLLCSGSETRIERPLFTGARAACRSPHCDCRLVSAMMVVERDPAFMVVAERKMDWFVTT